MCDADDTNGPGSRPAWQRARAIIAALTLLVSLVGLPQVYQWWRAKQPPTFTVQCEGAMQPDVRVYEVTEELAPVHTLLGQFQITVSAHYSGDAVTGPVLIRIVSANGTAFEVARWDDFRMSHQSSLSFTLTPSDLFAYSGVPSKPSVLDPTEGIATILSSGQFDIEVFDDPETLTSTTVTVLNTPWVHLIRLSDSSIRAGEPITAYVTLKNVGSPSGFNVLGVLYESTSGITSTLDIGTEGWWPAKTWGPIEYWVNTEIDKAVETDGGYTVSLPIPGYLFKERHTYILETYVVKELPYLKFPDGDWLTSEHAWRVRDRPLYSTIVVLGP